MRSDSSPRLVVEVPGERLADDLADLAKVVDLEAAGGERRRADAQAGRDGRRAGGSKGTALRLTVMPTSASAAVLGLLAVEIRVAQVGEQLADVGAAGEHVDAGREHLLGQRGGALAGAALALAEELGLGDLERHRLAGDHVHERSAL